MQPNTISITRDDITTMEVDVIVDAANRFLIPGAGVCGAIHAAGGPTIHKEAQYFAPLATGGVVMTTAGELPSQAVIHTVGPVWGEQTDQISEELLSYCYSNALELTRDKGFRSIAFPNISTGIYGYPKPLAAQIAIDSVLKFAWGFDVGLEVTFSCHDLDNYELYVALTP